MNEVELTGVQVSKQGCVSITRQHWTLHMTVYDDSAPHKIVSFIP